jgi:hypothetical protein
LSDLVADAARERRFRRCVGSAARLCVGGGIAECLSGLLSGLSGFAGIARLRRLLGRLHVLLRSSSLLARVLSVLRGLVLVERLLSESTLRLSQLLTQLAGGVVQLALPLLLRGGRRSWRLAELFHLLRKLLLLLSDVGRLLTEFRIRARVRLQRLSQLARGLRRLLAGL